MYVIFSMIDTGQPDCMQINLILSCNLVHSMQLWFIIN